MRNFTFRSAMLLFFCFSLLLVSCNKKEDSKEKLLVRKWQFQSVKDASGDVRKITGKDFMALSQDKKFNIAIADGNISATGNWEFRNDTIFYTYDPKPGESEVDSTAYVVRNGEPTVIYFSDGKILAEVKGSGLSPNKLTKPYQIVELTDEKLVLVENGVTNTFTYKKTEALIT
ncbi:MAG: hypothetical protein ACXWB5_07080, partial [Kaistella sp.]